MADTLNVTIAGCNGRMGRMLIEASNQTAGVKLVGAFDRQGSPVLGVDAGELVGLGRLDVSVTQGLVGLEGLTDVIIDFTAPEATLANIDWCVKHNKKIVIGTTGFNDTQKQQINDAAQHIAIMMAPNMSVAVNVMFKLLEQTARVMGRYTDIEIIEAHHRFKKDAPSGTALKMGEVIADELGRDLKDCATYSREGIIGERAPDSIGFSTIRAGSIVGEHTAMFADLDERLEITHKSNSRATYANGALRAALWLNAQQPGLYDMQDVLGLRDA